MNEGSIRDEQLAAIITRELELIFAAASDDRLAELTVVGIESRARGTHYVVTVAPDEGAEIRYSAREMDEILRKASGFIRSELALALNLKRCPSLTLVADRAVFP